MWPVRVQITGVSALAVALLVLWGCGSRGPDYVARREPWRSVEEQSCLSSGFVRESPFLRSRSALGGSTACGTAHPFEMAAVSSGRIFLRPPALLRCPMIPTVDKWLVDVVEPAARYHLGATIAEVVVASSYSCRPVNHRRGGWLSEHGHANAIDISGFVLSDGRKVTVRGGWWGNAPERNFLRAIHNGACREFMTVLGPNADGFHRDHFHLDLARHGRDGLTRVCR